MTDSRFSREHMAEVVARGVRSAGDLPLGTALPPEEQAPEERERHRKVRERVRAFFAQPHQHGAARLLPGCAGSPEDGSVAPPCLGVVPDMSLLSIPRLHLHGDPETRARQAGAILRPILGTLLDEFFRQALSSSPLRWLAMGYLRLALMRAPEDLRREIRAFARAADVAPHTALVLTVMGDFHAFLACSTVVVSPPLVSPGRLLFGRNLDFAGLGLSDVAALLTLHHPESDSGELPTASLGWAGLWGIHTGWNAAGLCFGNMQVYNPGKDSPSGPLAMLSGRTPTSWAYTRLLRHHRTTREVVEAFEASCVPPPLSPTNLTLADAAGEAAVIEWDIRRHRTRRPEHGHLFATNFFRHPETRSESFECWRGEALERELGELATRAAAGTTSETRDGAIEEFDVPNLIRLLDLVNQGELTLHSVVFEPARRVHLSAAHPPSTRGRWNTIPWDAWSEDNVPRRGSG